MQARLSTTADRVDHSALRVNQGGIILTLLLAFLLNAPLLVGFVALLMVLGTLVPEAALFKQLYHRWLRPAGWVQPDYRHESAAPHRFAQGVGAGVLLLALLAFSSGAALAGWALAALVVVLAALNLFSGFCAGCFLYFQLDRLRAR